MMPKQAKFSDSNGRFELVIAPNIVSELLSICAAAGRSETGGIVLGKYVNDRKTAKVTRISSPPVDSERGRTWFVRGLKGLQDIVDRYWNSGRGYYIGEWHFHPFASPEPSGQDLQQMKAISKSKQYNCREPLLVILGGDPSKKWELSATVVLPDGKSIRLRQSNK